MEVYFYLKFRTEYTKHNRCNLRKLIFTFYEFLQLTMMLFSNSPACGIHFIFLEIMLAWIRHKI